MGEPMNKSKELKKKFMCYSSIAAGALAIAGQAEAAVVYSGLQNIVINTPNTSQLIDLNNDGTNDFGFRYVYSTTYFGNSNRGFDLVRINYNQHIDSYSHADPARLPGGYLIQPNLPNQPAFYWDTENNDTLGTYYGSSTMGVFRGQTGYIGVRFQSQTCNGSNYHYGWIQFSLNNNATSGTIIDWAYETNCNQPIQAGQQQVAVPAFTPAGIAVAAGLLSGAGIRALRKRKKEEKA